jgi:SAM-dependent methyltransferase
VHHNFEELSNEVNGNKNRVKSLGKPNGRLLDYGCGSGNFVFAALEEGWDAYGMDPYLPSKLKEKKGGERFIKSDITDLNSHQSIGKFQCITIWAAVEHMTTINSTFSMLSELLSENGILVFNSPYGDSIIAKRNGSNWRMAALIEHLQFFNVQSVNFLAKSIKLKVLKIENCGSPFPLGSNSVVEKKNSSIENNNSSNKNKIKNLVYKYALKNKKILIPIINKFKIGDHILVVLKK